jgi:hypothetical protein
MPKLTEQQIRQKLTEGCNYKRLYRELKDRFDVVATEHKQCPQLIADLTAKYDAIIETQAAQIAELQTMVFGRKPKGGQRSSAPKTGIPKQPRDAASYRRPIPPAEAITSEEYCAIDYYHHCGDQLTDKKEHTRYEEDIVLATLNNLQQFKTVTRQIIERGYCVRCGKHSSAIDLRGQQVTVGPNIRSVVCYLITLQDHSYDQVIRLLWDLYHLKLTDGEVTVILDARRLQPLPTYEESGLAPAVHMDESR